jgi:hypothetical protein
MVCVAITHAAGCPGRWPGASQALFGGSRYPRGRSRPLSGAETPCALPLLLEYRSFLRHRRQPQEQERACGARRRHSEGAVRHTGGPLGAGAARSRAAESGGSGAVRGDAAAAHSACGAALARVARAIFAGPRLSRVRSPSRRAPAALPGVQQAAAVRVSGACCRSASGAGAVPLSGGWRTLPPARQRSSACSSPAAACRRAAGWRAGGSACLPHRRRTAAAARPPALHRLIALRRRSTPHRTVTHAQRPLPSQASLRSRTLARSLLESRSTARCACVVLSRTPRRAR